MNCQHKGQRNEKKNPYTKYKSSQVLWKETHVVSES